MAKKNIVITISKPPHGTDKVQEGLRMAVGLCAGEDEHDVSVIFSEDGIYNILSDVVWDEVCENCWKMLKKLKLKMYVDSDSMQERGVHEADMDDPMALLKGKDVIGLVSSADVHMDF
jgi:sulfur relay (sulfurtransferase) DsrF/TusC family protein